MKQARWHSRSSRRIESQESTNALPHLAPRLARRDLRDLDGVADHLGGALFTFRGLGASVGQGEPPPLETPLEGRIGHAPASD